MKRILIVEDEVAIREFEAINLKRVGYETVEAGSGEEALEIFDNDPIGFDVALLDVMMPGMDGFALCKELRSRSDSIGIIMLTAKSQEMDKISGLLIGADDYVTKPFSPSELLARVDSLYRRVSKSKPVAVNKPSTQIESGRFVLDLRSRSLSKDGKNIELTQIEFQIMEYFFDNPDEPISRTVILHKIWGEEYFGEEKIVDVNIRRLRMKIEEDSSDPKFIVTVWGRGYMWDTTAN
ncbi:MAG: response regulator transcription factor [Clostridia bacterium]|nr:response regulator transcription factor [Clostridia bacterium]